MDVIDHDNSQNQQRITYMHTTFLRTRKRIPKFVRRQNENVRVAEKSLTDGDDRVKRSDRGNRSLKGPMEVPVEEISSSRHVGSTCKALSHGRAILCYPVRDVRRVNVMSEGQMLSWWLLCVCRGHKCNRESIRMWTHAHVCACGWIRGGVSECPVWMLEGAYTPMYLPLLVLFNPLWGMNETWIIIFLSQSLSPP